MTMLYKIIKFEIYLHCCHGVLLFATILVSNDWKTFELN